MAYCTPHQKNSVAQIVYVDSNSFAIKIDIGDSNLFDKRVNNWFKRTNSNRNGIAIR